MRKNVHISNEFIHTKKSTSMQMVSIPHFLATHIEINLLEQIVIAKKNNLKINCFRFCMIFIIPFIDSTPSLPWALTYEKKKLFVIYVFKFNKK